MSTKPRAPFHVPPPKNIGTFVGNRKSPIGATPDETRAMVPESLRGLHVRLLFSYLRGELSREYMEWSAAACAYHDAQIAERHARNRAQRLRHASRWNVPGAHGSP